MKREENIYLESEEDPFDVMSFLYGMAAGGIIAAVLGGIALYFTWPYLVALIRGFATVEEIKEVLGVK